MHAQVIGALNVKGEVCELRWLLTAIHTTALQNFAKKLCVVPFLLLLSEPVAILSGTLSSLTPISCFCSPKKDTRGWYLCNKSVLFTKTSELSERPADLFPLQANTILHKSVTNMKNISQFS